MSKTDLLVLHEAEKALDAAINRYARTYAFFGNSQDRESAATAVNAAIAAYGDARAARAALSTPAAQEATTSIHELCQISGHKALPLMRAFGEGPPTLNERLTMGRIADALIVASTPAAQEAETPGERAWLVEWKAHGYGPQWWGFKYTPGKRGDWCHDANDAIRFSRKVDAERMRLHVIAVADLTGHHEYERSICVTEHEWLSAGAPVAQRAAQEVRLEPVAWRIRIGDSDSWSYCSNESDADFIGNRSGLNYAKQALYAAPQPPQQAQEVSNG